MFAICQLTVNVIVKVYQVISVFRHDRRFHRPQKLEEKGDDLELLLDPLKHGTIFGRGNKVKHDKFH